MPLLLHERVAFIHIPKTGGTTIEQILIAEFPDDVCFICARGFGPLQINSQSAAVRAMSARANASGLRNMPTYQHWRYSDIQQIIPDLDTWWSFAFVRSPWARLYSEYRYQICFLKRSIPPFERWVAEVLPKAKASAALADNHFRPQWEFLGPATQVYRFEEFDSELARVAAKLRIPLPCIPQHLKSGDPQEYRSVYSKSLIDLVGEHYYEDISRFGYRFD